jgi:hypothetical protein
MSGFVEGTDRSQSTLFPAMLDDYVAEDNLFVRLTLSLKALIFAVVGNAVRQTRRPSCGTPPFVRPLLIPIFRLAISCWGWCGIPSCL